MVAGQQQSHGTGEGQAAVAPVCAQPLIADVRSDLCGEVCHVREREEAQAVVAYAHLGRVEVDVLQGLVALWLQGEVALYDACLLFRADDFRIRQPAEPDKAGVVHDMLKLIHSLQIACSRFTVHLPGDDMPTAES